ncbi:MAG: glycosyltransferase family 4 protein, partial [Lachnospiraceae bacterium]|nr:glycosyltransferase family 4 protein [Lachnospiraceae bacterium]
GCRSVVSIYDLSFFRFPQATNSRGTLLYLKYFSRRACRTADGIHAISEATKKDIREVYGTDADKIRVIYLDAPKAKRTAEAGKTFHPKAPYFLFVSTIEPRKNLITLLKAYERFMENTRQETDLVLAGRMGWKTNEFSEALRQHAYRNRIHVIGYVDEEKKKTLLKHAEALLYPSLYEGFGLPVLEAMQCGLPVITTRVSSMPEVGGDAALYVEHPTDPDELARQMEHIVLMSEKEKAVLRDKMEKNCRRFSWEKTAHEMMTLLTGAAAS